MATLLTVMPTPVMQFFSDIGQPLAGGLLYTYAAGTSTLIPTYTDSAGLVPNSNPIFLDAAGKAVVYLSPVVYKFDVQNNVGVSVDGYPRDNIVGFAPANTLGGVNYSFPTNFGNAGQFLQTNGAGTLTWATPPTGVNNFRLTLTTGVPVTTADVTAATTIFCTPNGTGNHIELYDTLGNPTNVSSAQFSIAVPPTTSQMYDIFCFNNGGVPTLELLAWTSDTARATAIVLTTTGSYTKAGDLTRRYLASFRTTTVAGQTEDSFAKRYLWNFYNRAARPMRVVEATDTWAYTTATIRQANGAATNQLDCVVGVAEVLLEIEVQAFLQNGGGAATDVAMVLIGEDSTTTMKTGCITTPASLNVAANCTTIARLKTFPAIGRHFYPWLEFSTAVSTTTWKGDNGSPTNQQSGIHGVYLG